MKYLVIFDEGEVCELIKGPFTELDKAIAAAERQTAIDAETWSCPTTWCVYELGEPVPFEPLTVALETAAVENSDYEHSDPVAAMRLATAVLASAVFDRASEETAKDEALETLAKLPKHADDADWLVDRLTQSAMDFEYWTQPAAVKAARNG